jgi:hypothetical protein
MSLSLLPSANILQHLPRYIEDFSHSEPTFLIYQSVHLKGLDDSQSVPCRKPRWHNVSDFAVKDRDLEETKTKPQEAQKIVPPSQLNRFRELKTPPLLSKLDLEEINDQQFSEELVDLIKSKFWARKI